MINAKLAIVGSQELSVDQAANAYWLIDCIIRSESPRVIISGGAVGVDTLAENAAIRGRILRGILLPKIRRWEDHEDGRIGFKSRNMQIALACDELVSIRNRSTKSYGSGWTADYAEKELGKVVRRIYV